METKYGYEYMCEQVINERSICTICIKPLVDPVATKCQSRAHIFCRHCLEQNLSCPMCCQELHSDDLIPVTNQDLIDALDNIPIKCLYCQQTGIRRGDFNNHQMNMCSKGVVSCRSSNVRCSRIDRVREQLDKHFITSLQNENQRLNTQIDQQEIHIQRLQCQNQQLIDQMTKLNDKDIFISNPFNRNNSLIRSILSFSF